MPSAVIGAIAGAAIVGAFPELGLAAYALGAITSTVVPACFGVRPPRARQ
jgi:hypothetical protein